MGSSFTNLHVRSEKVRVVGQALKRVAKGSAMRSKVKNGWVSIFNETMDTQDIEEMKALAGGLSKELKTIVVGFLVHDSDTSLYVIYENGELIDAYSTMPFEEIPEFGVEHHVETIARIVNGVDKPALRRVLLRQRSEERGLAAMEESRVSELAVLFGIDPERATAGFRYLSEDGSAEDYSFADKLSRVQAAKPVMNLLNLFHFPTLERFRAYIAGGGDINDPMLWTPLLVSRERSEIAHLLLDTGATVSGIHEPLYFFCQGFDESVIRRVFEMIEDKPRALNVAMFQIAGTHLVDAARVLLSLGAEINIMHPDTKVTPLMSAASWRQGQMVELLLKAGAYRAPVDSEGRNAAAYAKLAVSASKTHGVNGPEEDVAWILKLLESAEGGAQQR